MMPMIADGAACDRCGQQEESTSILLFVVVSDVDSGGAAVVRYYCRRNQCSNEIRAAGTGTAPHPQTTDVGTTSNQLTADGTIQPPATPPAETTDDTTTTTAGAGAAGTGSGDADSAPAADDPPPAPAAS